jgi:hypothetical protein
LAVYKLFILLLVALQAESFLKVHLSLSTGERLHCSNLVLPGFFSAAPWQQKDQLRPLLRNKKNPDKSKIRLKPLF